MPTEYDATDVTDHSVILSGLTPETQYRARVRSTDPSDNISTWSDWINFTTAAEGTTEGMYTSAAELAGQPMSGTAWDNVLAAADAFDPTTQIEYDDINNPDSTYAMAAGIVYARTGTISYAEKVRDAVATIAANPYDKTHGSITGWGRNVPSWVVATDLINLADLDPTVESSWQTFLSNMPLEPYVGSGQDNLQHAAEQRANNIGHASRAACITIAIYTGNQALLDLMADLQYSLIEGGPSTYPAADTSSGITEFSWGSDQSWQLDPTDPTTYLGITPLNASKDGNVIDGVTPDDYRRNGPYDPNNFPGPNTTTYPWGAAGGLTAVDELLTRAGYPARAWGDDSCKRVLARLRHFYENYSADGWEWGPTGGSSADSQWIIYLVNYMYGTSFPEPGQTSHGRPFGFTDFTHGGRVAT